MNFKLSALSFALCLSSAFSATAQTPKANGETLRLQVIGGSTANYPAIIAEKKGLCEKYGFKCEVKIINAGPLAMQALVGGTIDLGLAGADAAASVAESGGNLTIVATLRQSNPFSLSVRSDVPMPNKAAGYPAIMQDLKGKKIGVTGRGSSVENHFTAMLIGAGMQASDVTFVAVGGPPTAYQALTIGKTIDALMLFEPIPTLCTFSKACETVVDLGKNEGPANIKAMNGASIALLMRKDLVEKNPNLVRAYLAATKESVRWAQNPANFEEVVKIFEPIISFGDNPKANEMRRALLKGDLTPTSAGLETSRPALKAIVDFALAYKVITKPVDHLSLIWSEAP